MLGDFEPIQRLAVAHEKTKILSDSTPPSVDIHPGTNLANHWLVITGSYSGIEQAFKYLIAKEKNVKISELLCRKSPYLTHDLSWLFAELSPETKESLRKFYKQYQSLHLYIGIDNIDEFLNNGYVLWRYSLIQNNDKDIPKSSPSAMIEIWGACIDIAKDKHFEGDPSPKPANFMMPVEKLASALANEFHDTYTKVGIERRNAGEQLQDMIQSELYEWGCKNGNLLNAFAKALRHFDQHGNHGQIGLSEWLDNILTRCIQSVMNSSLVSMDIISMRFFVARACGRTPYGKSIQWNNNTELFEKID